MLTSAEQDAAHSAANAGTPAPEGGAGEQQVTQKDVMDLRAENERLRHQIEQIERAVMMRLNSVEARLSPLPPTGAA